MIKQVYYPYTRWEDWKAGMWQVPQNITEDMKMAAHILSSPRTFYYAARAMLRDWPRSAEHNLTNLSQNRLSWVGQATCCHLAGISEMATRQAWWTLTPKEQRIANETAQKVIDWWERTYA
jgi:hypothetical protein